jgi:serine/threonine-protein kinase
VDGPSAADLLREDKMLGVEQTVLIVRDACHGLDYAHRAGVIHRDVKPGNLLVSGGTGITKLADFGIAKAAEQTRITQVGSVLGTAAYLSPEQARGDEAGPASDTYSLGVCAYQFLTGRLPHEYSSLTELALKQQQEIVQPIREFRPEVPAELDEAVRLCLEREPGSRYRSALEMAEAIEAGFHGEATDATRRLDLTEVEPATQALPRTAYQPVAPSYAEPTYAPTAREREEPRRRRGWSTFFALLLVLAAIGAVGAALIASSNNDNGVSPVNEDQVQQQIDGLRQFLQDNTK